MARCQVMPIGFVGNVEALGPSRRVKRNALECVDSREGRRVRVGQNAERGDEVRYREG